MTQPTSPPTHSNYVAPILLQDIPILQIPLDVAIQIFTRLRGRDVGTCSRVCRQWNLMLKVNEVVWRLLCERDFPRLDLSDIKDFQDTHQTIYSNFTKGVFASHTFQGHAGWVASVAIADGMLFSSSGDTTI